MPGGGGRTEMADGSAEASLHPGGGGGGGDGGGERGVRSLEFTGSGTGRPLSSPLSAQVDTSAAIHHIASSPALLIKPQLAWREEGVCNAIVVAIRLSVSWK